MSVAPDRGSLFGVIYSVCLLAWKRIETCLSHPALNSAYAPADILDKDHHEEREKIKKKHFPPHLPCHAFAVH